MNVTSAGSGDKKSCLNTLLVKGIDNFNWIKKRPFFIRVTAYKNITFSSVFICSMSNTSIAWKLKADFCFLLWGYFLVVFPNVSTHSFLLPSSGPDEEFLFNAYWWDRTGYDKISQSECLGMRTCCLNGICSLKVCSSMTHLMLSMKAGL